MSWAVVLIAGSGCSFLSPGWDTRTATEARSVTTWDGDNNLALREDTTHNREVIAAEGEGVSVEMEQGEATRITGGTHVLWQKSRPKDVGEAYMHLADRNAEAWSATMRTITQLLNDLYAARQRDMEIRNESSVSRIEARIDALTALLHGLRGGYGPMDEPSASQPAAIE